MFRTLTATAALALLAGGAQAAVFSYSAFLNDDQSTVMPDVERGATGTATLAVDDEDMTLDFDLDVVGITIPEFWDELATAPIGPLHLHNAPAGETGPIVIPFPLPFDVADGGYEATGDGFSLSVRDYMFQDAIELAFADDPDTPVNELENAPTFDQFLAALNANNYYANIHTDQFNSGEIRGQVIADANPIPLPAGGLLLIGGLGALAALRRKG